MEQLARAGLRNPVRVKVAVELSSLAQQQHTVEPGTAPAGIVEAQRTPASLHIQYQQCSSVQKLDQVVQFLQVSLCSLKPEHRIPQACLVCILWADLLADRLSCMCCIPNVCAALHCTAEQPVATFGFAWQACALYIFDNGACLQDTVMGHKL